MHQRRWLDANTLPAQNIQHQLRRPVVPGIFLVRLEDVHILNVFVEEKCAIRGSALSLGVELCREDRSRRVEHTLVAPVVEVHKVLLEIGRQASGLDSVAVVLGGDDYEWR